MFSPKKVTGDNFIHQFLSNPMRLHFHSCLNIEDSGHSKVSLKFDVNNIQMATSKLSVRLLPIKLMYTNDTIGAKHSLSGKKLPEAA